MSEQKTKTIKLKAAKSKAQFENLVSRPSVPSVKQLANYQSFVNLNTLKRPSSPSQRNDAKVKPNSKHSRNSNFRDASDDVTPEYFTKTVNFDSLKRMILQNQRVIKDVRSNSASSQKSRTKSVVSESKPRYASASKSRQEGMHSY